MKINQPLKVFISKSNFGKVYKKSLILIKFCWLQVLFAGKSI